MGHVRAAVWSLVVATTWVVACASSDRTSDLARGPEASADGGAGGAHPTGGIAGSSETGHGGSSGVGVTAGSKLPTEDAGILVDGSAGFDVRVGSFDSAPPPPGLVPMFVASGQGGRTITSCDDGRTWVGDHSYEAVSFGSNINYVTDSAYASKGLAYGQGTFISLMAWGGPASLKISDDGVNWTRVFNKLADSTGGFFGGLGFGGGVFVLIRQQVTQISIDQGKTWSPAKVQTGGDVREGGGGGDDLGIFAGGSGDNWMSWDDGKTWKPASGCPKMGFGAIGEFGGVAVGAGNLVMVGDKGDTCRVFAGGSQYQVGTLGEAATGKVFFTGERFWVMNGSKAFTSDDGAVWKPTALQPASTAIQSIARGATGTYVGAHRGGGRFYRSTDGINWTAAVAPASGNQIFRIVAGYGKPSQLCPAR
jgi:hypothetical protein